MLEVTGAALNRLSKKLAQKKADDGETFRFIKNKGGWKLSVDRAQPGDKAFLYAGREVLVLDPVVTKAMARHRLDVHNTERGERLKLQRTMSREA